MIRAGILFFLFVTTVRCTVSPNTSIAYIPAYSTPGTRLIFNVELKDIFGNTVTPTDTTRKSTRWTLNVTNSLSCDINSQISVTDNPPYHVINGPSLDLVPAYRVDIAFDAVALIGSGSIVRLYDAVTAANWGIADIPGGIFMAGDFIYWSMTMKDSHGSSLH